MDTTNMYYMGVWEYENQQSWFFFGFAKRWESAPKCLAINFKKPWDFGVPEKSRQTQNSSMAVG
jgi:hypothetical protein